MCVDYFDLDDFAAVMNALEFVEVACVNLPDEIFGCQGPSKLMLLLDTVLHPIAGEQYCFFYENPDESEIFVPLRVDDDSEVDCAVGPHDGPTRPLDEGSLESLRLDEATQTDEISADLELSDLYPSPQNLFPAPVFVRFLLDNAPASAAELANNNLCSKLSALISVFKENESQSANIRKVDPTELQSAHLNAALELAALLNAYVAELTLEKIRRFGSNLEDSDIRQAKSCLGRARNIISSTMDIFFYAARINAMVAASEPEGNIIEVDEGFTLLISELKASEAVVLRGYTSGTSFLLETIDEVNDALVYWCFLRVHGALGVITIEIHHPDGPGQASELLDFVVDFISVSCHRVNQLLLLRRLHSSRSASRLLISPNLTTPQSETVSEKLVDDRLFCDGVFSCPIVYQTSFDLFHRCAANPAKIARTLEATVLHIFAISNRRELFVYKDESGAIFYLGLATREGVTEVESNAGNVGEGLIELLVYGIEDPGPSITQQLKRLLQKRLLLIAVDMLSSVLTKNPHYHWRQPDISFIRSFQSHWDDLDDSKPPHAYSKRRRYALPLEAYDPGMIIILFRQNLCGSTFFHALSTTEWVSADDCGNDAQEQDGGNLHFDPTDLVLYYNTSPSKLDPSFQTESTLTSKGAQFSRRAGSGIAIVELSLENGEGKFFRRINAAIPTGQVDSSIEDYSESMLVREVDEDRRESDPQGPPSFVQICITGTALKTDVLHQWLLLSLTQALFSWNAERCLERMQKGLIRLDVSKALSFCHTSAHAKKMDFEYICSGLPGLTGIFESAEALPHPAVLSIEYDEVVRSSAVASVAYELLEKGILDQLRLETKIALVADKHFKLCIVRSCRSSKPVCVQLERDDQKRVLVRCVAGSNDHRSVLQDSPIDCPEYTILLYSLDFVAANNRMSKATFPKLFEEVRVGYEKSGEKGESAKSLYDFKRDHPSFFRRSFAFIFSIKRNRRRLLAYNWSAQLFKRTTARLQEMDRSFLVASGLSAASLQYRSLRGLAPASSVSVERRQKQKDTQKDILHVRSVSGASTEKGMVVDRAERMRPPGPRPSMHPHTIRRPKLVGKSVEGSAMQAVARSRARASSGRYKGGNNSSAAPTAKIEGGATTIGRSPSSQTIARKNPDPIVPSQLGDDHITTQEQADKELSAARKHVDKAVLKHGLVRLSTLQAAAHQTLTKAHWPIKSTETISLSLAEFIFSVGSLAWKEASTMLPFPEKLIGAFSFSLGQTLAAWTPGFVPVPIRCSNATGSSFFLMGKTRNLRNCKGFIVVKFCVATVATQGKPIVFVSSEGRVLTLPRRTKKDVKVYHSQATIEKCSAGLDKLSADLHTLVGLQGKLLDHVASVIERTMKSAAGLQEYDEVLRILRNLIEIYPLQTVMKSVRSNYKVLSEKLLSTSPSLLLFRNTI